MSVVGSPVRGSVELLSGKDVMSVAADDVICTDDDVVSCGCSIVVEVGGASVVVAAAEVVGGVKFPESIPTNTGVELGPVPALVEA